jgi:hypothetical protein
MPMGAGQDLDCVSAKVEAHCAIRRVVDHQGDWATVRGELIGLPPRGLLPHSSQGLADEADGTLSRVEVDAKSLGPKDGGQPQRLRLRSVRITAWGLQAFLHAASDASSSGAPKHGSVWKLDRMGIS